MKFDFLLFGKGLLMGAADIVPGVSGGTIAFISGIYEHLILSLKAVFPAAIQLVRDRDLGSFWARIDGSFLLTLFAGILSSVVLFAQLITYLLHEHPIPLWAFFFGLIVASVFMVAKQVSAWSIKLYLALGLGALMAWLITTAAPIHLDDSYANVFFSGVIAICAMILPGISGSFILVIMGMYTVILGALQEFDLIVLGIFCVGCVVGLLSIANVLAWAFSRFHGEVLALLTGFMIGALNKVWPWKEVLTTYQDRHGQLVPLLEANVTPTQYEAITGMPSQLMLALVIFTFGFCGVIIIERVAASTVKSVAE